MNRFVPVSMKTIVTSVLILSGVAATANAQSLVEMARSEAQRRAAIEQPAPLFTNADLVAESTRDFTLNPGRHVEAGPLVASRPVNRGPISATPFVKRAKQASTPLLGQPSVTLYQPVRPASGLRQLSQFRPLRFGPRQMRVYHPVPRKLVPHSLIAAPRRAG